MRQSRGSGRSLRTLFEIPSPTADTARKFNMTPLGWPVEPEVYMIIARSSGRRAGRSTSGAVLAISASQPSNCVGGASGSAIHGRPSGTPPACCSQVSSLPTNSSLASLCSSKKRSVSAPSVGKIATVVQPAIQIANSAVKKCAQFFDRMATWQPAPSPRLCR